MAIIKHVYSSPIADGTDTSLIRPSDWNASHAFTGLDQVIFSNTAGGSTVSSGTIYLNAGAGIVISQNKQSVTVEGSFPAVKTLENMPGFSLATQTFGIGATSIAVSLLVENNLDLDYIRIPANITVNSTTAATTANTNASVSIVSSWNAVLYTRNTGNSFSQLVSVTSAQGLYTFMQSVSIASSTRQSHSQYYSYNIEGTTSLFSTSYTVNTNSVQFLSTALSNFSGVRFIDIPFAATLTPNGYWMLLNVSTSSASNAGGLSNATTMMPRYSNVYGATQVNSSIGYLGQSNRTSGGYLGAGSVTTSPSVTQSTLPVSAISSSASHQKLYFQLLGS